MTKMIDRDTVMGSGHACALFLFLLLLLSVLLFKICRLTASIPRLCTDSPTVRYTALPTESPEAAHSTFRACGTRHTSTRPTLALLGRKKNQSQDLVYTAAELANEGHRVMSWVSKSGLPVPPRREPWTRAARSKVGICLFQSLVYGCSSFLRD